MTETELNEQIAALPDTPVQEGRGRCYRRRQKSRKGNRFLRKSHYGFDLAPFSTRFITYDWDWDIHKLLHSGAYIGYFGNSNRKRFLKKYSNKCVRRYPLLATKGNRYRRVFDYWWQLD